jgi:hypothetical protein
MMHILIGICYAVALIALLLATFSASTGRISTIGLGLLMWLSAELLQKIPAGVLT